jgi:phosphoribosyl 1,2-cyclic phosphodiesterase
MRITFFGTRGSIATPGEATLRYGGNTSCVEVQSKAGTRVIIDAGTGMAVLGRKLMTGGGPVHGHVLISHMHWDHINGIPFFIPFFVPGNEWHVYGPHGLDRGLQDTLAGQMQYTYFPVTLDQLGAALTYHDLVEGKLQLGDITVTAHYLNHTALTLGYKLEADGVVVVYACDHEPHDRALADGQGKISGKDLKHAEFIAGADLVIHDAQYLASEYEAKIGWGHSTVEYSVAMACFAGVKRLALTHHDPCRDDGQIDRILAKLALEFSGKSGPEIFAAAEGQTIDLVAAPPATAAPAAPDALQPIATALVGRSILLVTKDPTLRNELTKLAASDQIAVLEAEEAKAAQAAARERPSLVMLDDRLDDARAVCRSIRAIAGYGETLPVVLVVKSGSPPESEAPFTDVLIDPVKESYVRTRLRAWIMRVAVRWVPATVPADEERRLSDTRALGLLDTGREERFDRITRLASALLDMPIALVSLIDANRQWFKSACGLDLSETPRKEAFCAHVVYQRAPLVVPDALADDRFADYPAVTGPAHIRAYMGYPLFLSTGSCVGTLCLLDQRPRQFDAKKMALLGDLAALVVRELEPSRENSAAGTIENRAVPV